jgi:hypothetical protein
LADSVRMSRASRPTSLVMIKVSSVSVFYSTLLASTVG